MVTDPRLKDDFEFPDGSAVELFGIVDEASPGRYYYRMQYYDPETGTILRYDNAHDSGTGHHHRHYRADDGTLAVEAIEFEGLEAHTERFLDEVYELYAQR